MADGSFGGPADQLLGGVGRERHLVARCAAPRCGCEAPCDPQPWLASGLGGLPLSAFSDRFRCVCGSREAVLEVRPGPYVRPASQDIHLFR
jgi:hypothetical protein